MKGMTCLVISCRVFSCSTLIRTPGRFSEPRFICTKSSTSNHRNLENPRIVCKQFGHRVRLRYDHAILICRYSCYWTGLTNNKPMLT
jgi:hypothetical protein